jgi:hypothetical protein
MVGKLLVIKCLQVLLAISLPGFSTFLPPSTAPKAAPITRYVATSGTDSGNCSSSSTPCRTIQYAVNQTSSGDRILVAQGTYIYNAASNQCPFLLTPAVVCFVDRSLIILGGYSTSNWVTAFPSTNLTVIDGQNTYRGVAAIGYLTDTVTMDMEGFTIQNGYTLGPTYLSPYYPGAMGGGMLVQKASITLRDMIFSDNTAIGANTTSGDGGAADGAAIRIESSPSSSSSLLQRVTFVNNHSYGGSGPVRGGVAFGAVFIYASTVVIEDSTFTNNLAQAGNSPGGGTSQVDGLQADALGGAVSIEDGALTLTRVNITGSQIIAGNATSDAGGAFGGGIFCEGIGNFTSTLTMTDSIVTNNSATAGNAQKGGNAAGGGIDAANCQINLNRVKVINNIALGGNSTGGGNAGPGAGGGIYIFATRSGVPRSTVINVIIADNFADQGTGVTSLGNGGGGGMIVHGVGVDISHATFARNRIGTGLVLGQALVVQRWVVGGVNLPADVNLNYSIVADHTQGNSLAAAVIIQSGASLTFNRGLFAGNTKNTNSNNSPVPAGTINGLATMLTVSSAGFISPGSPNYDYHLRSDSAARDQASGSTISMDIDGQSRPYNTIADLGADEYWSFPLLVGIGNTTLYLDWTIGAAALSGAVDHYDIVVTCAPGANHPDQGDCGIPIDTGLATRFTLSGLSNFMPYTMIVHARDGLGNTIASTNSVTATPTSYLLFIPLVVK